MDKESFKIGDKVKISSLSATYDYEIDEHLYNENIIGVVVAVNRNIYVKWNTNRCIICGSDNCGCVVRTWYHKSHEIERVKRVGEQLLFNFMKGD